MFLLIMKKRYIIIIILILMFFNFISMGQSADEIIPPGMELRVVGQTSIVVPKDAEIREKGGLIIVEQIDKYVARTLSEMKKQIEYLKEQQEKLSKEVEQLKAELAVKNNI